MRIREATAEDFNNIWPIFHEIVSAGETYAYEPAITKEAAFHQWMAYPQKTFVAEEKGEVMGTYFIKRNHQGAGSHVCNCGYMVASQARGKGVATKMCLHSQEIARQLGYKAMQFNFVIETNQAAIRLWQRLEFEIVGTVPKAFRHPKRGYVAAHIMFKWLDMSDGG